jgi:flavin-dependent dehydrogenase
VNTAQSLGVEVLQERLDSINATTTEVVINDRYAASAVVAADGANSRCRRLLGLAGAPPAHLAFAVRGYAPATSDVLELRWEPDHQPSYSWVFPVGDGTANVGYGHRADAPGAKTALWEAVARTTGIDPSDPSLRAHHLPLSSANLARTKGRILFVGDAARMINPLSGEGIFYALAAGRTAGTALATASDPAAAYESALRIEFGAHFRATALAHRAQQFPRNIEAAVRAAAHSTISFDQLAELALGAGTLHPGMVPAITRQWITG